jgi:hypothetical protein
MAGVNSREIQHWKWPKTNRHKPLFMVTTDVTSLRYKESLYSLLATFHLMKLLPSPSQFHSNISVLAAKFISRFSVVFGGGGGEEVYRKRFEIVCGIIEI